MLPRALCLISTTLGWPFAIHGPPGTSRQLSALQRQQDGSYENDVKGKGRQRNPDKKYRHHVDNGLKLGSCQWAPQRVETVNGGGGGGPGASAPAIPKISAKESTALAATRLACQGGHPRASQPASQPAASPPRRRPCGVRMVAPQAPAKLLEWEMGNGRKTPEEKEKYGAVAGQAKSKRQETNMPGSVWCVCLRDGQRMCAGQRSDTRHSTLDTRPTTTTRALSVSARSPRAV